MKAKHSINGMFIVAFLFILNTTDLSAQTTKSLKKTFNPKASKGLSSSKSTDGLKKTSTTSSSTRSGTGSSNSSTSAWTKSGNGSGSAATTSSNSLNKGTSSTQLVTRGNNNTRLQPLGRGSTGRVTPRNVTEQTAMKEIKSNPSLGKPLDDIKLGKPWPAEEGWKKMAYNKKIKTNTKNTSPNNQDYNVEIHYNAQFKQKKIVAVDDFKFKDNLRRP